MLTLDALRAWGANVEEGMTRCLNMEALRTPTRSKAPCPTWR